MCLQRRFLTVVCMTTRGTHLTPFCALRLRRPRLRLRTLVFMVVRWCHATYCAVLSCAASTADSISRLHYGSAETPRRYHTNIVMARVLALVHMVRRWRCLLDSHCRSDEKAAAATAGATIAHPRVPAVCACCARAGRVMCGHLLTDTTIRCACRGFGCGFPVMMCMATARATVVT